MARVGVSKPALRNTGGFTVQGLNELYAKVSNVLDATTAAKLKDVFMEAGAVGKAALKAAAPYSDDLHGVFKKTGIHLRDAIFLVPGKPEKSNVYLGVSFKRAPQGYWREHGTVTEPAQPWFKPTINATKPAMARVIVDGMKNIIEAAAK